MELVRSMVEQSSVPLWNLWQFDLEEKAIFICISGFVWGKWFTLEKEKGISQIEMFLLVLIAKERKEHNVRQFLWISLVLRSLRKVPCALFSFFLKIVIFLFLHVFSPFSSLLHFTPISVDFYFFPYLFCLIHLCQANNHVQR